MTTPATQSSSALGRRSLPSTFFESIQTARRFIERRDVEDDNSGNTASAGDTKDGTLLQQRHRFIGSDAPEDSSSAPQPATPMAFAEVARQVWGAELEPRPVAKPGQQAVGAPSHATAATPESVAERRDAGLLQAFGTSRRLAEQGAGKAAQSSEVLHLAQDLTQDPAEDQGEGQVQGLVRSEAQAQAQGLAHDANNLLSALRLYSDLLCFSGVLHERHRHYADDLKLLSQRSQRLIEQLLLLADQVGVAQAPSLEAVGTLATRSIVGGSAPIVLNPSAGEVSEKPLDWQAWHELPAEVSPEAVSVTDTVRRISGVLGTIARGALQVNLPEAADLQVTIGKELLERILVNLVTNAAAAVREGGAIRIRAAAIGADRADVALTVDDSGRGMSEAELAFALGAEASIPPVTQQGLEMVPAAPGMPGRKRGLGLAIVRQLAAESGGSFFVYSQPGRGTRIEIRWRSADAKSLVASAVSPQAGLATNSQAVLTAGAQMGSQEDLRVRPLPFVSWKNPAAPSHAAGPVSAGTNTGNTGRAMSGSEGAVAC